MPQYTESQYRFTDPIRYFKSNDPIYYEVENIPLKQLQENNLWLRDQVKNVNVNLDILSAKDLDRNSFSELKPYVNGTDNVVYVKPGRFTARINDAYNLTPLQILTSITGSGINEYNTWYAKTLSDSTLSSVIYKFKQNILTGGLGMNGLAERAFSYPAWLPDKGNATFLSSTPPNLSTGNLNPNNIDQPIFPLLKAQVFTNFQRRPNSFENPTGDQTIAVQGRADFIIKQYASDNVALGFASLQTAEPEFIKRWRGIARTAIVDVSEQLNIEIPAFDANDFYYKDEYGVTRLLTNAIQRIDLLFIYSKAIDTSSTTVAKFDSNGLPTTLTRPALGIVRGAGIGLDYTYTTGSIKLLQDGFTSNGDLKILPNVNDQASVNTGFTISGVQIAGSFPSPDDLMNLTPLLDEELTTDNFALVGQSILPIAYIVVKKTASLNEADIPILNNTDVIDIRPFFRTTELSYNERAGIAAAVPAPSLANPIVTQAEMDYELKRLYNSIPTNFQTIYVDSSKTIYLQNELLLASGTALNDWGNISDSKEIIIPASALSGVLGNTYYSPDSEMFAANTRLDPAPQYRKYLLEVMFKVEGVHTGGDVAPHSLFVSIVDRNADAFDQGIFRKVITLGTWIDGGDIQNGDGYGGNGAVNNFSYYVPGNGSSDGAGLKAPVLPLRLRTYAGRQQLWLTNSVTASPGYSSGNIIFKLYLTGFKIMERSRFSAVPIT